MVQSDTGVPYEMTFNTWGYDWPSEWSDARSWEKCPQQFGRNAYTGLYQSPILQKYIADHDGAVKIVEMGCGTGAGAHHVCKNVLPKCTYEAFDMQEAAIRTCQRKFVPELGGRLVAKRADCTNLDKADGSTNIVAVCETHVAEYGGRVTEEDKKFFGSAYRILEKGGFLTWGNAIPDDTWQPCFDYLESIGMKMVETHDVTSYAVTARDLDRKRVHAFVEQVLNPFLAFRIPFLGPKKRREAELAMKNFYRDPGTPLYDKMTDGTDTYRVALFQKV
jgi:ubiquinone/menaquinone biosynthesis C-methylase UbiE